ncbi:MAG TPA: hypothetical protein VK003_09765 [Oceanobacillus sp.]|nr:hypothetical protein [Oceanobacillus sp.]
MIKVGWDNDEKTIIIYHVEDDWSAADFFALSVQIDRMIDTVEHVVDIIGVYHRANIPSGDFIFDAGGVPFRKKHPRRGREYFVGMNYFLNNMASTLHRTYPDTYNDLALAPTTDEARKQIAELKEKRKPKR